MSDHKTKHKLALANAIFRKTFGLTLKGNVWRVGNPTTFELKLMDVDGALRLKLPSSKLIKSYLNPPKPPAPVADPAGLGHEDNPAATLLGPLVPPVPVIPPDPVVPPDTKPLAPMYYLPQRMLMHPEDSPLLTRQP
jgi:hypothetical protein